MSPWLLIGIMAALLTMFGFVPQLMKMYRTKSVSDVSLGTLCQFTTGVSLWAVYGFLIRDMIIIVANIISLATLLASLGIYLHYRSTGSSGSSSDIREVGH